MNVASSATAASSAIPAKNRTAMRADSDQSVANGVIQVARVSICRAMRMTAVPNTAPTTSAGIAPNAMSLGLVPQSAAPRRR